MKRYVPRFTLCMILGFVALVVHAQDGWLFSAQPPIVVRFGNDGNYYFTNTSDHVLHGITIHNNDNGKVTSKVLIDTLEPHKTAALTFDPRFVLNTPALTCTDYSKPLPIKALP